MTPRELRLRTRIDTLTDEVEMLKLCADLALLTPEDE